jgi:hypothetical protein
MLFEAEFSKEIERQIAAKQANKDKSLVERLGLQTESVDRNARFAIAGDDESQTLMWRALMKDCAFYFDAPSIDQENKMRRTLQRKYDGLFNANWRPSLGTRRDLVTWACNQYNGSLLEKGQEEKQLVDCDNYQMLLREFGPDYNKIRGKMGHIRGLFD